MNGTRLKKSGAPSIGFFFFSLSPSSLSDLAVRRPFGQHVPEMFLGRLRDEELPVAMEVQVVVRGGWRGRRARGSRRACRHHFQGQLGQFARVSGGRFRARPHAGRRPRLHPGSGVRFTLGPDRGGGRGGLVQSGAPGKGEGRHVEGQARGGRRPNVIGEGPVVGHIRFFSGGRLKARQVRCVCVCARGRVDRPGEVARVREEKEKCKTGRFCIQSRQKQNKWLRFGAAPRRPWASKTTSRKLSPMALPG